MSEQLIPIDMIDDPEFNSRLSADPKGIKELAESMPTVDKQINAITVEGIDNRRYLLVTGSRRCAAARLNGWTEIRADVRPSSDEATRLVQNFVENNQRRDLSLYEQARAITKMRELNLKGTEIAAATGYSASKVSNLAGMYSRLPQEIHEPWRDGHKAASFEFLQQLTQVKGKTPEAIKEAQIETWNDRAKLYDKLDSKLEPTRGNGKDPDADEKEKVEKEPTKLIKMQRYFDICRAVQKSKLPGAKLALECMKALIGETNKVKTVWDADAGTQAVQ